MILFVGAPALGYAALALPLVALLRRALPGLLRETSFVFAILWIWNLSVLIEVALSEFAWMTRVRSGGP